MKTNFDKKLTSGHLVCYGVFGPLIKNFEYLYNKSH